MRLIVKPLTLELKRTFHIAHGARDQIEGLEVRLDSFHHHGVGTSFVPSYFGSVKKLVDQIHGLDSEESLIRASLEDERLDPFARAAVYHALVRLEAMERGMTTHEYLDLPWPAPQESFYTIGVCPPEQLEEELEAGKDFKQYKLKFGGEHDLDVIHRYREICDKPFAVDANQAWKSGQTPQLLLEALENAGCLFIEQPFMKEDLESHSALRENTSIPIILDESVMRLSDISAVAPYCDGINVKLLKLGGVDRALKAMERAKSLGLKVLLGCITEDARGIEMALLVAYLADWVDLDGAFLLKDPGEQVLYEGGKVSIPH